MTEPQPTATGTALTFFNVSGDYQCANDPLPQSTTSAPLMAPIQGLVTFTARLPKGFQAFVPDFQIATDSNCQQLVSVIGAVTGGTFALMFNGLWTAAIPAGATPAQVASALEALSTVGTGNVSVTGNTGGPWTVEFIGTLANAPQSQMEADPSLLQASSGTPAVSVEMLNTGSTSRTGPTAIAFPPRTGRIWTTGQLCSINVDDSPGVQLTDSVGLGLSFPLVYDVTFTQVQLGNIDGDLAPFAITAPGNGSGVCLTDPTTTLLPWQPPIQTTWFPGWVPGDTTPAGTVTAIRDWRGAAVRRVG